MIRQYSFERVPPLQDLAEGKTPEEVVDQAQEILGYLEGVVATLKDSNAFWDNIRRPTDSWYRPDPVNTFMEQIHELHMEVEEPLFTNRGFMPVWKLSTPATEIGRHLAIPMNLVESSIEEVLGYHPGELPSAKSRPSGSMYHELAGLDVSSELPSLMDSFDSSSQAEIKKQARCSMKTLGPLFDQVKALTLNHLSRGKQRFLNVGFKEFIDCTNHLALLRNYVTKIQRKDRVITKFMAERFDLSVDRLERSLKAFIVAFDDLPNGEAIESRATGPLRASCKDVSRLTILKRCEEASTTAWSLIRDKGSLERSRKRVVHYRTVNALLKRVDIWNIEIHLRALSGLQYMTRTSFLHGNHPCAKVWGERFIKEALATLEDVLRADIMDLERLNSDLEALGS